MFIGIHKADDYGKLSSSVYKVTGLNLVSPKKPSDGMDCGRGVNVFPPQVIKDFQMQWPVMPLVGFVEIDRNLHSHRVWHFTAPAPERCRPALLQGIVNCC